MENEKLSNQKSTLLVGLAIVGSTFLLLSSIFFDSSSSNSKQVATYRGNLLASAVSSSLSSNPIIEQTVRASGKKGDAVNFSLPSWSPGSNELILVTIATRDISDTPFNVIGNGINFEKIASTIDKQETQRITVFRGMSSSPSSGNITFSWTETSSDRGWSAVATRISGVDTTGTNGSGAIDTTATGSVGSSDTSNPKSSITTTSNNVLVYGGITNRNRTITFGDGWTPVVQGLEGGNDGSNMGLDTAYKIVPTAGKVDFNVKFSSSGDWTSALVSIKSAISTTPSPDPIPTPTPEVINVLAPKENDNLVVGNKYRISWTGVSGSDAYIYLNGGGHEEGYSKLIGRPTSGSDSFLDYTITNADLPTASHFTWKVFVCNGVLANGGSNCGYSGTFYVTSNPTPAPTPTPTDAVVSDWSSWKGISDWSTCTNGKQERTEQRTRTIITPATNGGATPALAENRTTQRSCTPPAPTPTDTVVSAWSAWEGTSNWSECVNGKQTRTEKRTRTVITPATNGGVTPALSETRTGTQSCTVQEPPTPTVPLPTLTFGANPLLIDPGQSSTLSWSSTNTTSCSASGGWSGNKSLSGTQSVSPTSETTYSVTCENSEGKTVTKTLTVYVKNTNTTTHEERLSKSRAEFASDSRINCSQYPEKRIFVETQAWWMRLDSVKFPSSIPSNQVPEEKGKGGHGHTATCFPIEQKIDGNGKMHFDVRLMLHKGNEANVTWLDIGLGPGGSSLARVNFNPPLTCKGGENIDVNCTFWVPIDLDLSKVPAGYQELRFRFNMIHPSGDRQYATTGWNAYYHGGTGGFRTPPWQEARGWWPTTSYTRSRLFSKLPMDPVSGNITLNIEGSNATQTGLHVDAFFNMNDFGDIVFETQKSFKGPLTIDTTKLSNGMHWVAILSSKAAGNGTNTTIFQFPIIVNN